MVHHMISDALFTSLFNIEVVESVPIIICQSIRSMTNEKSIHCIGDVQCPSDLWSFHWLNAFRFSIVRINWNLCDHYVAIGGAILPQ